MSQLFCAYKTKPTVKGFQNVVAQFSNTLIPMKINEKI